VAVTHEAVRERLVELEYGELPLAEAGAVEAHLRDCEPCRAEREAIAATRRTLRLLGPELPDPGGERVIAAAAREAAARARAGRTTWRTGLMGLAATAALVLVVGGVSWRLLAERDRRDAAREARGDAAGPVEGPVAAAARPEAARPDAARPEAARPEAARPEAARPAAARPAAARPETARPEAARPEAAPPAVASRGAEPPAAARDEAVPPSRAAPAAPPATPAPTPARPFPASSAEALSKAMKPAEAARAGGGPALASAPSAARSEEAALVEKGAPPGPRFEPLPAGAPSDERTLACPAGTLRVRAWRDGAGRVRRVVRELSGPEGVRTVALGYDEAGQRVEARLVASGPAGRPTLSDAEAPRDPDAAIRAPGCP
jgi:hypothetical protein